MSILAPQVCAYKYAHPIMCTQLCTPKYVHISMRALSYYLSAFAGVLGLELLPLGNAVVFFSFFLGGVSFRKQVQAPLVDTSDCWLPFSRPCWPDLSPLTMSPEPSCCFSLDHGHVKALQLCVCALKGTLAPSLLLPITFLPPLWDGTMGRASQLS